MFNKVLKFFVGVVVIPSIIGLPRFRTFVGGDFLAGLLLGGVLCLGVAGVAMSSMITNPVKIGVPNPTLPFAWGYFVGTIGGASIFSCGHGSAIGVICGMVGVPIVFVGGGFFAVGHMLRNSNPVSPAHFIRATRHQSTESRVSGSVPGLAAEPPAQAQYLLELFVSPELSDEAVGDLFEKFNRKFRRVEETHGLRKAQLDYWWQVLRSAPGLLKIRFRNVGFAVGFLKLLSLFNHWAAK